MNTPVPEFDVGLISELVQIARELDPPVRPATDDHGHQFYFFWSDRERMIQNLPVGWTYQAHTVGHGRACVYDPCPIEELDADRDFCCAYWYEVPA